MDRKITTNLQHGSATGPFQPVNEALRETMQEQRRETPVIKTQEEASAIESIKAAAAAAPGVQLQTLQPQIQQQEKNLKSQHDVLMEEEQPWEGLRKDDDGALIETGQKRQRFNDEANMKVLKWQFVQPRPEYIDQLREQMSTVCKPALFAQLFHIDFQQHLKAIEALSQSIQTCPQATMGALDLILKWTTLRFSDTNPSVLVKCLEYIQSLFLMCDDCGYILDDVEVGCFLPFLLAKSDDDEDVVRAGVRRIIELMCRICPSSKLLPYLIEYIKSKNALQRSDLGVYEDEVHDILTAPQFQQSEASQASSTYGTLCPQQVPTPCPDKNPPQPSTDNPSALTNKRSTAVSPRCGSISSESLSRSASESSVQQPPTKPLPVSTSGTRCSSIHTETGVPTPPIGPPPTQPPYSVSPKNRGGSAAPPRPQPPVFPQTGGSLSASVAAKLKQSGVHALVDCSSADDKSSNERSEELANRTIKLLEDLVRQKQEEINRRNLEKKCWRAITGFLFVALFCSVVYFAIVERHCHQERNYPTRIDNPAMKHLYEIIKEIRSWFV